jgi:cytoskeleton-associated protein 5
VFTLDSGSSVGSTTSSNDGSEKSVASSASSRSTGSVAPGSVKPPRSSSTTKTTTTDKPSATTTASSSTEVRTRRTSATTAPSSLSRESKPQLTRGEAITPLVANEDKAKRQRQDKDHITVGADDQARGGGWSFKTAPRPEHAQHLQQQARPYLGEALHAKMFSRDFRKHREALQELTAAVEDHPAATQQNADLLLKWASLRLFDANTSTQAKTLAFVEHLFRALDARDYQLTDYEAGVILPALLECLGQGEAMQEGIDALLKLVPRVYPSSKFFAFLLHAGLLGSKSPRTRAECLELMAGLVRRQGLAAVCPTPSAAFPQIAQFVTDKVSAVRYAALGLIQQAHLHAGDDLWLYTGSLNDTQRALIDQKLGGSAGAGASSGSASLRSSSSGVAQPPAVKKVMQHKEEDKRSSRSSSPSATAHKAKAAATSSSSSSSVGSLGSSKTVVGVRTTATASGRATASRSSRPASDDGSSPGPSSAALQPPPPSFSLELDKLQPVKSAKAPRAAPAALEPTTPVAAPAEPTSTAGSSVVIEAWVKELESGDVDKMIGVCKAILERLAEGVTPFVGCSDGLVQTLAGLLNSTLRQKDFSIDRNREFKYFVNVLFKLFTHAPLAIGISRDASKCVLHSLMVAFVDPLVVPRSGAPTHTARAHTAHTHHRTRTTAHAPPHTHTR